MILYMLITIGLIHHAHANEGLEVLLQKNPLAVKIRSAIEKANPSPPKSAEEKRSRDLFDQAHLALAYIPDIEHTKEQYNAAIPHLAKLTASHTAKKISQLTKDGWEGIETDDQCFEFKKLSDPLTPVKRFYEEPAELGSNGVFFLVRIASTVYHPDDYANVRQEKATGKTVWDLVLCDTYERKITNWETTITEYDSKTRILVQTDSAPVDTCRMVMTWVLKGFETQAKPEIKTFCFMNPLNPFVSLEEQT